MKAIVEKRHLSWAAAKQVKPYSKVLMDFLDQGHCGSSAVKMRGQPVNGGVLSFGQPRRTTPLLIQPGQLRVRENNRGWMPLLTYN